VAESEHGQRLLLGCLLLLAPLASAQEFSHDGNRWFEVEVSMFSMAQPGSPYTEIPVPLETMPAYLPRLLQLLPRSTSYTLAFPSDTPPDPLQPLSGLPADPLQSQLLLQLRNGPQYSPALPDSFRLLDPQRDPYIELDPRSGQFPALNRRLDAAGNYRVLWHALWRQPVQERSQVSAVFVGGGETRDQHRELEGSLRLSDNNGRVMLDLDVWLNVFAPASPDAASGWQIPQLPFATETPTANLQAQTQPTEPQWLLSAVWRQQQTRELGSSQLYYIDHPTLGVLVEIRPYVLPLPTVLQGGTGDF